MHKISFSKGIIEIGKIIKKTKIVPDVINVGGGFSKHLSDLIPEPLENYLKEIKKSLENLKLDKMPEIFCEPGRAIVASIWFYYCKSIAKEKNKNFTLMMEPMDLYLMQEYQILSYQQNDN